jgi:hypothetical protein
MGKSTISTGPWLQWLFVNVYQAGYLRVIHGWEIRIQIPTGGLLLTSMGGIPKAMTGG